MPEQGARNDALELMLQKELKWLLPACEAGWDPASPKEAIMDKHWCTDHAVPRTNVPRRRLDSFL